eukprot:2517801-Prymnesium_polylepis.1
MQIATCPATCKSPHAPPMQIATRPARAECGCGSDKQIPERGGGGGGARETAGRSRHGRWERNGTATVRRAERARG